MERRQFLQSGAAAGALGLSGVGCASIQSPFEVPGVTELLALDMDGFLARLDSSLGFIRSTSSLSALIPSPVARKAEEDARFSGGESLVRDSLRSLLLTSSFGELPEAGQAHPGMQARVLGGMSELDDAVLGMHRTMKSLSPTERADASRALRQDPSLRSRVLGALDREAELAGVAPSRRAHMAKVAQHAAFRLQQSSSLFFDDMDRKVEKVAALSWSPEESEHRLRALMGEKVFEEKRARMLALAQAWRSVPGIAQGAPTDAPAAPGAPAAATPGSAPVATTPGLTPAPPPVDGPSTVAVARGLPAYEQLRPVPRRGVWTLRAGGMLCGLAVVHALHGLTLVLVGGIGSTLAFGEFTHGALLLVGGIVTLIVGAVQLPSSE